MNEKKPDRLTPTLVAIIVIATIALCIGIPIYIESESYEVEMQSRGVRISDVFEDNAEYLSNSDNRILVKTEGIYLETESGRQLLLDSKDFSKGYPLLIYRSDAGENTRWNTVYCGIDGTHIFLFSYSMADDGEYKWWGMKLPEYATAVLNTDTLSGLYVQSPQGDLLLTEDSIAYRKDIPTAIKLYPGEDCAMWVENGKAIANGPYDNSEGKAEYDIQKMENGVKKIQGAEFDGNVCDYYIGEPSVVAHMNYIPKGTQNFLVSAIAVMVVMCGICVYPYLDAPKKEEENA